MKLYLRIFVAIVLPLAIGCLLIVPTIRSDNGYVAGFAFLPFLFLSVIACVALLLAGLIMTGIKGRAGLWWLPAGPLIVIGFFGLAIIAKQFEIGAYEDQPMMPIVPTVANRVDFKQDTTEDEINKFWNEVIGEPATKGGTTFRPGVKSCMRDGALRLSFSFSPGATEEQKDDIRARIKAYPPVDRYKEGEATIKPMGTPSGDSNGNIQTGSASAYSTPNP